MKKFNLLAVLLLLLVSCNKDEDDITVPLCNIPNNLNATAISDTSASLTWDYSQTTNESNITLSFKLEYGPTGFSQGTGTVISTTLPSLTLNNLQPNRTYDFYVQTICSANNTSVYSEVGTFATLSAPVATEFKPTLSQMNLFQGNLSDLIPSEYAFEYDLNTRLFTDYAHKQRFIVLPTGEAMTYNGDGLPNFPDNTVIAKTFFYNVDDRNESLGKNLMETRVMIKKNGAWETGDYKWNDSQTEATLDADGSIVPVTWTDSNGTSHSIDYQIPSNTDCFTCHQTNGNLTPIGPKLRSMNFNINGENQLQKLKDLQLLSGLSSPGAVGVLPNWEDTSTSLEQRARAYFDMQCAHCHSAGGFCETQSTLRLSYETSLEDSKIVQRKNSISSRINAHIPGFSMPYIGTTIIHTEGVALIQEYLDTL